jgi:hypothetical protein
MPAVRGKDPRDLGPGRRAWGWEGEAVALRGDKLATEVASPGKSSKSRAGFAAQGLAAGWIKLASFGA